MVLQVYMIFIGMTHIWKKEDIEFLKENYPTEGGRFCADKIGIDIRQIHSKTQSLNLSIKPPINISNFTHIKDPKICYVLGLLWADGSLRKPYTTNLECVKDDMVDFEPVFDSIGVWKKYERERGHRPQKTLTVSSKCLVNFLLEHGYGEKSINSPTKILSKIPEDLKHYFFRGFLDGDGCFYYNPKQYAREVSFSGSYNQDWSDLIKLYESLGVKNYRVYRRKTKHGGQSALRVTNKEGVKLIGEYIYSGEQFGLTRKKEKFNEIIKENN